MEKYKAALIFDADGDLSRRWFVFYYFRDPYTGKFVRFRSWISNQLHSRTQRYDAARELRKSINIRLAQGWNPFVSKSRGLWTVTQALDYYIDSRKSFLRKRTNTSYKSYINALKTWLKKIGYDGLSVESFSYYHAKEYMDQVAQRGYAIRTWNNTLQAVRTCFNFLIKEEFLVVNPFFKIHKQPAPETEIIAFSSEELNIIRRKLKKHNHNLYVIALLIFNCFLRPQEIVRLRVRQMKKLDYYLAIPGEVSKNKKSGTVSVPEQLRNEIRKMDLDFPDDWFVFGKNLERNSREMAPTRIAESWKEFKEKYGISRNIYALKHTGNGLLLENGENTRNIQLQNRHSSLDETQKYLDRFSRMPDQSFSKKLPRL